MACLGPLKAQGQPASHGGIRSRKVDDQRYADAATFLLRWGLAAEKCNATHSQCKVYLSAIIVYLYANDLKQAEKCYNDCCQIDAFLSSDQNRCASKLLSAYSDDDVEEIKWGPLSPSSLVSNPPRRPLISYPV
ncbi:unnamed protein product [Camellia sinensis]